MFIIITIIPPNIDKIESTFSQNRLFHLWDSPVNLWYFFLQMINLRQTFTLSRLASAPAAPPQTPLHPPPLRHPLTQATQIPVESESLKPFPNKKGPAVAPWCPPPLRADWDVMEDGSRPAHRVRTEMGSPCARLCPAALNTSRQMNVSGGERLERPAGSGRSDRKLHLLLIKIDAYVGGIRVLQPEYRHFLDFLSLLTMLHVFMLYREHVQMYKYLFLL